MRHVKTLFRVCALSGLWSVMAWADTYETTIDIDTEDDLYEMAYRNEISDETLETLLELLRDQVNLNTANRDELYILPNLTYDEVDAILAYRSERGAINNPAELVEKGLLTKEKLQQISPFLTVEKPQQKQALPLHGSARVLGAYTLNDLDAPPAFGQFRAKYGPSWSAGSSVVTTRLRLGNLSYDEPRQALSAASSSYQVHLPKLYAQWKSTNAKVLVGTFRMGFAQRLVLDNTTRRTPSGIYGDDVIFIRNDLTSRCRLSKGELDDKPCDTDEYTTPDFVWRDSFRGIAASYENLKWGSLSAAAYGFASYQTRSIYQYELYNTRTCDNPEDEKCRAPEVFLAQEEVSAKTAKVSYSTLPNVYNEWAGGGHLEVKTPTALSFGLTGYAAAPVFQIPGAALDFQDWSRVPSGGPFGAIGANAQYSLKDFRFFAEAARSFDSMTHSRGGGYGAILRNLYSTRQQEWELSLRYYDKGFANPYARPQSAPDEFQGQRARNEAGAMLRFVSQLPAKIRLRGVADFWVWPEDGLARETAGTTNLNSELRGDYTAWSSFQPGVWGEYRNKGLAVGGRGECFSLGNETNDFGEPLPCFGEFYRVGARVRMQPWQRKLTLTLQYMRDWLDDVAHKEDFRQDSVLWAELMSWPTDSLRLRTRVRHWFDDVSDNTRLEQSWWVQSDVMWKMSALTSLRLRYDYYVFVDERASTQLRTPNPEHRLRLEFEGRF